MISLLQLEYFLTLAEEQHMSKAAEKLYVSQSTVSTMIARLERELGVLLFDRKNNRIYLNGCGEIYYQHIKAAMAEIERANNAIKGTTRVKLSVSVSQEEVWQDFLWQFRQENPTCYIEQFTGIHSHFLDLLLNGTVDFVITGAESLQHEKLDSCIVCDRGICAVVPHGHHLAEKDSVSLAELQGEPYIDLSQDAPFRRYCDDLCAKASVRLNRVMECDYALRRRMVSAGQGITLIVDSNRTKQFYTNVSFIPVSDPFARRKVSVYWLRNRERSMIMEKFLRFIAGYSVQEL